MAKKDNSCSSLFVEERGLGLETEVWSSTKIHRSLKWKGFLVFTVVGVGQFKEGEGCGRKSVTRGRFS